MENKLKDVRGVSVNDINTMEVIPKKYRIHFII